MRTRRSWLFLAILPLLSCHSKSSMLAPGPAMQGPIHFEYAVYLPKPRSNSIQPVKDALQKYPGLLLVNDLPKQPQRPCARAFMDTNVPKNYPTPLPKQLEYAAHGLTPDQVRTLQTSQQAIILKFTHPIRDVWTSLHTASSLVEDIALQTGGFIWDDETREIFSPTEWHELRLTRPPAEIPQTSNEVTIHIYQTDTAVRLITLGMAKMGLPDVVVQQTTWSSSKDCARLINLFCQSLAEGRPITKSGRLRLSQKAKDTTHNACLTLKPGRWEEGDPRNRLIELDADEYQGPDIYAKQDAMLSTLFDQQDPVKHIEHTPELLAASNNAKNKLPGLQKVFAAA